MSLRHFSYISETKISMLEAQIASRRWAPGLSAKAGVPGFVEVGAQLASRAGNEELIKRTISLTKKLTKQELLRPLSSTGDLDTSLLYQDMSVWSHGLFAFTGDTSLAAQASVFSYLAWRRWNDAIILLAGSPHNVLGERIIRDGVWAYGTTGTWNSILQFVETLETDERNLTKEVPDAAWVEGMSPTSRALAPGLLESPGGLSLAVLCLRHLSGLVVSQLETVFRIHRRIDLGVNAVLPQWVTRQLGRGPRGSEQANFLRQCRAVYTGSPLYTAIA